MIKPPGRAPTRLEQIQLSKLLTNPNLDVNRVGRKSGFYEEVIIHHITENTPYKLQLEIERRTNFGNPKPKIKFERVYL